MLNILVNAYAVNPYWGSEQGLGWNWVINLANYCNVYIITEGEFRDNIENEIQYLPQKENIHFYYNPLPDRIRKMCWNQGDWRFYWYYQKWQKKTLELAQNIIAKNKIDIIHQLNMIGFREPGYLWKIKDIPFVWGPIGGMELVPVNYLTGVPIKQKVIVYLKNILNNYQTKHDRRVYKAINHASQLIAAVKGVKEKIELIYKKDVLLLNETGCKVNGYISHNPKNDYLKILWVGKFDFRKQLRLAINIIAKLKDLKIEFHIVGGGTEVEEKQYKKLAYELGIDLICHWHGVIKNEEVQKLMRESDLLLFTSIMEGTPHVVLEAISNCLPVLCFDACGQSASVNNKVGIKVKLTSTNQSINDFATQIRYLSKNREVLANMSTACVERQEELSWNSKAQQMVEIYHSILK